MNTHASFHKFSSFLREQRLNFYKMSTNEEALDLAEKTDGTMEDSSNSLQKLQSTTEAIAEDMKKMRIGFWERVNRFGSSDAARTVKVQQRVKQEAQRRLDEALGKGERLIKTRLRSAERKLLLQNIEQQILEDLQKYLQLEQNELQQKSDKYARWSQFFAGGTDAISVQELNTNQKLLQAMQTAEEELTVEMNGKQVPESVALAQQTETVLREQLIDLNIVHPDAFDSLLDRHFAGTNALIDIIKNAAVLKKNPALQKSLLRGAQRMRKRGERSYRLYRLAQEDQNIGSLEERLAKITENTSPGFPITLELGGQAVRTKFVRFHGSQCILRDQSNPKRFVVLDRAEKSVAYRDSAGQTHDVQLTNPKMIILNSENRFSTAA